MIEAWSPMMVAVVSGVFLIPPAVIGLVGVLAARSEPRRAKELLALNSIIKGMPEEDPGTTALQARRSKLAVAYGERETVLDPVILGFLLYTGGFAVLWVTAFLTSPQGRPAERMIQALTEAAVTVGIICGLFLLFAGVVVWLALLTRFVVRLVRQVRRWQRNKQSAIQGGDVELLVGDRKGAAVPNGPAVRSR